MVGWQVYEAESSDLASEVMRDMCAREHIRPSQVVFHSDNGSPMKGATMLAKLQALGVTPSCSRPAVSNDNPYSESLFKTMKYRPAYPNRRFGSLLPPDSGGGCVCALYNEEHRHSAIRFIKPPQRHAGLDIGLLKERGPVYEAARTTHPQRWSGGTRNWDPVLVVHLNPAKHAIDPASQKEQNPELEKGSVNTPATSLKSSVTEHVSSRQTFVLFFKYTNFRS
nr:integrase core domain-containing protein [Noviherbaspirillum suwonense]